MSFSDAGAAHIAIEGIDGSGKSTFVGYLRHALERRGRLVVVVSGGSFIHLPTVRSIVGQRECQRRDADFRPEFNDWLHGSILREAFRSIGAVLVSDRTWWTPLARAQALLTDSEHVFIDNALRTQWLPDCVVHLDVALDVAVDRLSRRSSRAPHESKDQLEQAQTAYHEQAPLFQQHGPMVRLNSPTLSEMREEADHLAESLAARVAAAGPLASWQAHSVLALHALATKHVAIAARNAPAKSAAGALGGTPRGLFDFLTHDPRGTVRPRFRTGAVASWAEFHLAAANTGTTLGSAYHESFQRGTAAAERLWAGLPPHMGSQTEDGWAADISEAATAVLNDARRCPEGSPERHHLFALAQWEHAVSALVKAMPAEGM